VKLLLLLLGVMAALLLTGGLAGAQPSGDPPSATPTPTPSATPTPYPTPPVIEDPPIVYPPDPYDEPPEDYVEPPEDYVEPPEDYVEPPSFPRQRRGKRGLCPRVKRGEHCGPGLGRRTAGGGDKVSHRGWPAITGVFFVVQVHGGKHRFRGTKLNDELLGYDGHDHLDGGKGKDVLWGGYRPVPENPPTQHDTLLGGPGRDFIYPSHGRNLVKAGPGNDRIYAHWGRGVIDCGPGDDWVGVNKYDLHFTTRNCERVVQW
jgi:RTX calcium-binding nonapeptide repeat (4 copies)